ncbi:M15 family metallopeptidase [Fangia hongkongensis]|uniref:M15 family metallopeptidase n=1 Tax=Fangia hongkongensis TaxID=270495 RepID=UPI00036BE33E|nr:M15 family metallopeptidase [Fangia hongkongensis]
MKDDVILNNMCMKFSRQNKVILTRIYISLGLSKNNFPEASKLFSECPYHLLINAGKDVFNREIKMDRETFFAWQRMQQAGLKEGIYLSIVSAFRSYQYQYDLIQRKLEKGQLLEDIVKVNVLPGLSEHHTGRALDLTSSEEDEVLTESFEQTEAFGWLMENAQKFGFYLSYPRDNDKGVIYEPWHWCYHGAENS